MNNTPTTAVPEWVNKKHPDYNRIINSFTPIRDGWVRWYNGKTRWVCGKSTPLERIERRWIEVQDGIDKQDARPVRRIRFGGMSFKAFAGEVLARMEGRLHPSSTNAFKPHTMHDYKRMLDFLKKYWGPEIDILRVGPSDFDMLIQEMRRREWSPYTVGRYVAYVRAFFQYAKDAQIIPEVPEYGPDFKKPPKQDHRDARMDKEKAFTPQEICQQWLVATQEQQCWIALGLNCAFDNSDIATLTHDDINLDSGVIDFKRRKKGKVRRVCPLLPITLKLLKAYKRPKPAAEEYEKYFFLAGDGRPLVRIQPKKNDPRRTTEVNVITNTWKHLVIKAGLRNQIKIKVKGDGRTSAKFPEGDWRGFRSFRTSFANLAPYGYRDEVEIVLGHAHGSVLLENYLEKVHTTRLKELVTAVWKAAFTKTAQRDAVARLTEVYAAREMTLMTSAQKPSPP